LALPLLIPAAALLGGCLGDPPIEDRWTRLDVVASSPAPYQSLPGGSTPAITVSADITYRRIVTGFAVAELRASTLPATGVVLHPDAPRLQMARDIDLILQNSVPRGRATRAITGWDHLIQRIDFSFTGSVPAAGDSTAAGLFLICYLGSGEEVELADGTDSLIVTPFPSEPNELLPVGLELTVAP
jgi:hypothetical protein